MRNRICRDLWPVLLYPSKRGPASTWETVLSFLHSSCFCPVLRVFVRFWSNLHGSAEVRFGAKWKPFGHLSNYFLVANFNFARPRGFSYKLVKYIAETSERVHSVLRKPINVHVLIGNEMFKLFPVEGEDEGTIILSRLVINSGLDACSYFP